MKKSFFIICLLYNLFSSAIAQVVQFNSSNIEAGIRHHLGIGETDYITIDQIDTITHLDLSGYFIRDIRDIGLLANVKYLDLSNNVINDVAPLVTLDSLRYLNLSNNNLESISMLSFTYAKEMYVNVAFNYIKDFSCFKILTNCNFTIDGAGMQEEKEAPYFKVYHLYSEVDNSNNHIVSYRGYTNIEAEVTLQFGSNIVTATLDGNYNMVAVPNITQTPIKVILSNGEVGDTTYVVPIADYKVNAGKTIVLKTGLPEYYRLSSAFAKNGSVEILGNTMKYTASDDASSDIIEFCYYQGTTFKGMSHFYINREPREDILGDVNNDGTVDISDYIGIANYILGSPPEGFNEAAADVNEDHVIDISDYIGVANIILTGKP